ncbi:transposase [Cobetia amphilecti]|nr:transposase [Cobetia amphilecti]
MPLTHSRKITLINTLGLVPDIVERSFIWLKVFRRVATRYYKLPRSFHAMVCVACLCLCCLYFSESATP